MVYQETRILKDSDSASFADALDAALDELKTLAGLYPSLIGLAYRNGSFKADFRLDGEGSQKMCLHVAALAADVSVWEDVTCIKFIMVPKLNTASFELVF
ncbi:MULTISPECIES: hypothetical protein [Pseudomonas]|uniref:hypothetical protein n=1 Tax=Pseudomonas TaxID=286 RepID=UPI000FC439CF|nr:MULTISPECIES: hypothetical protein [Pseudomonas]MCZ2339823.1 hypothetical protein [Chitinophagales bacterium]RUE17073.1 hypothetical protein IPC1222_25515 [Pseudomonas aeruginosa]CAH0134456.1 hypothetical protein SRABI111_00301 [Pseudomonas carnis]CAH0137429.1 hypothetical protein SRABI110_00445 [Pseudomonas carnis]CAH0159672.1 hypothetical protein SRABI64_00747 [Pseudomonas carnis]